MSVITIGAMLISIILFPILNNKYEKKKKKKREQKRQIKYKEYIEKNWNK